MSHIWNKANGMTESWHRVGQRSDVSVDEPMGVTVGDQEIGIYLVGETLHAIENVCPHAFALLSDGFVDGEEVECPLHEAVFHIPTGRCLKEPADRDLKKFEVKTDGEDILVKL